MLARAPVRAVTRVARRLTRDARMSTVVTRAARKPGVATDDEFDAFLATHDRSRIVVVDARNPDFTVEPDDETYGGDAGSAPISDCGTAKRPNAVNAPFDRAAKSLPVDAVRAKTGGDATTPIVTHCGGGGRGQKAKDFLMSQGYVNVINGGGPAVEELWEKIGSL